MQEDKAALFDALATAEAALQIAQGVLATVTPNEREMRQALNSFMLATDLSEYLVRKGVPFRQTHHVAGRAVQMAEERGCALTDLSLADLQTLHELFEADVRIRSSTRTPPLNPTARPPPKRMAPPPMARHVASRGYGSRASVRPSASEPCDTTHAPPRYGPDRRTQKCLMPRWRR